MASPQLDQSEYVQKRPILLQRISLEFNMYAEAKQIRDMLGMSEKDFIRFCVANMILGVKHGSMKVYMSKEYMEKIFRDDTIEAFDKVQSALSKSGQLEIIE
jgi:hypothetical protein